MAAAPAKSGIASSWPVVILVPIIFSCFWADVKVLHIAPFVVLGLAQMIWVMLKIGGEPKAAERVGP